MNTIEIAEQTAERLYRYSPEFSSEVVENVAQVAADVYHKSLGQLFDEVGLHTTRLYTPRDSHTLEIAHIAPRMDYDEQSATVMQLPWGVGFTKESRYILAILAEVLADQQLLVFANPTSASTKSAQLRPNHRPSVASGDLEAIVRPIDEYLSDSGIVNVKHIGYSLGAAIAMALGARAAREGTHNVLRVISEAPVNLHVRRLGELATDFMRAHIHVDPFKSGITARAHREAWTGHDKIGFVLRMIGGNAIAQAYYLTHNQFIYDAAEVLRLTDAELFIAWGGKDPLVRPEVVRSFTNGLRGDYGQRVQTLCLEDQDHGLSYDPYLFAAIAKQGLK